ncbi:unnamed protein product [Diabrotica balteata]|uniref:Moesin/ezrin/radixin homolog 1 n=1 Tax=Diabrotica balteata TaxID=107213 RepID=A0A9N9T0J7_DIABA|nr:unnamed protein product [Diabrotica balteata]
MESNSSNRGSTGALSSTTGGSTSAGMHHSLSTPAGVDCGGSRTPPATPKKGGKMLAIRVQMLDDTVTIFQVQAKAVGRVLFEQVCKQLHLLEADYFGLEYSDDHGTKYWLDLQKPISRQLGLSLVDPLLYFCVKFYTPDPAQLEEEYTRYLFCLQVKRDLSQGSMQCNENTAALMASYIVQAECGDYVAEDYPDHTYLSSYKFVPQQDHEMERKIMENHKKHAGQSPAEADLNLLETARRCELYGVKMHPAKDHENVPLNLAVAHMGIIVFQNYTKINTFSWAKIRKISFKRKRFLVKLHPEGYGYYKDTVEFFFEGRNECKNFWKKCVENHGFFRCSSVKHVSRHKTRVLSRGSSFRYSGKTQKQIIEFVRDNYVKRQTFQRSQSFRHSSAHSSASNMHSHSTTVGNSISAHPLLPLADTNLSDDSKKELLEKTKAEDAKIRDNNNFYTSTPLRSANGNVSELSLAASNGNYSTTNTLNSDDSPSKVLAKEQLMNSINANTMVNAQSNLSKIVFISGNSTNTTTIIAEIEGETKKKSKHVVDKTYYIAKEILMTELTYKKDLDVINVWFRDEVGKEEPEECQILLSLIAPLAQAHGLLVKDLEKRLKSWDIKGGPRAVPMAEKVADVLLAHLPPLLPIYEEYLDGHMLVLERLDTAFKQNNRFEQLYRDFETQKVCYLPLTTFVLKPLHRLLQYQSLLKRLLNYYDENHPDRTDCRTAIDTLKDLMQPVSETLEQSKNLATLCELQRDIVGFDNLVQPGRTFIRHGCLLKHSRKGYQQRMFFLFSDILLYTSRSQATLQFKVHGHMPLRGVLIEEPDGDLMFNGLIIYGGNRALTVAANSLEEKEKWKNDLQRAIQMARDKSDTKITYLSLKSCSSSDEHIDQVGNNDVGTQTKPQAQRSNTTVHVCWHRSTSISMKDELLAVENQLSGYLLRKFKSSNGWQKLWVVFTSFCLFFYKGCIDDFPLASLPLLGYTVSPPLREDMISKDYVFKLQYKNHVYFFRAESEYTYNRWMEVIGSATQIRKRKAAVVNENQIETSSEK